MLLRYDIDNKTNKVALMVMPTPMPTWDGVTYVNTAALPTFRGGVDKLVQGDTSGFGLSSDLSKCSNLDLDIHPLHLFDGTEWNETTEKYGINEKEALVAFMLALTDRRVKFEEAPFDHPQLTVSNGNLDESPYTEQTLDIPEVGAGGGQALKPFLNLDPFETDGTLLSP